MISRIDSTLKIGHGVADGADESYIRHPSKAQTDQLLIRTVLAATSPLTVEAATRSKWRLDFREGSIAGYRMDLKVMGSSGDGKVSRAALGSGSSQLRHH